MKRFPPSRRDDLAEARRRSWSGEMVLREGGDQMKVGRGVAPRSIQAPPGPRRGGTSYRLRSASATVSSVLSWAPPTIRRREQVENVVYDASGGDPLKAFRIHRRHRGRRGHVQGPGQLARRTVRCQVRNHSSRNRSCQIRCPLSARRKRERPRARERRPRPGCPVSGLAIE